MAVPGERLLWDGDGGALGSARFSPPPVSESPRALAPLEPPPRSNTLLGLPVVAIESILSFLSYDEVSQLRLVCKGMDLVCQRMLNRGFLKVGRYRSLCEKQVKAQLPRRESERRNHSLAHHADILVAVGMRLSLLNMTFMKYVDANLCCFIPGKVIDETYRVLRYVSSTRDLQGAHDVLQELRDISSMAMEYFGEKIVPTLKRETPRSDVSGCLIGTAPDSSMALVPGKRESKEAWEVNPFLPKVPGPPTALTTMQQFSEQNLSRQEATELQQQVKANGTGLTALKREISELRIKVQEQQKQLQDQDQKLLEQTQINGELNARLAELERVRNKAARGHGKYSRKFFRFWLK